MEQLGKWIVGILACVSAVPLLVILGGMLIKAEARDMPLGLNISMAILPALFSLWWWRIGKKTKHLKGKAATMHAECERWIADATSGNIRVPNVGSFIVPRGQKALLAEQSAPASLTSSGARNYLGTRVKIGSVPLYFGTSRSTAKTLRVGASGMLVLTNEGLYFVSTERTVALRIGDIIAAEPTLSSIVVSAKGHSNPTVFAVANSMLWSTVIRSLASGALVITA